VLAPKLLTRSNKI
jgi:hypothetical protein